MRCVTLRITIICLGLTGACTPPIRPAPAATEQNGWVSYNFERGTYTITCDARPLLINGDRLNLSIVGGCANVQIAANHSDIGIDVVPGGQINIVGAHNDVTWNQVGAGPRPDLQDHGDANTYHRSETSS
jgi:hypothetical protein